MKQAIYNSYFNAQSTPQLNEFINQYPQFASKNKLKPYFLKAQRKLKKEQNQSSYSSSSTLEKTVSFCQKMSRKKMGKIVQSDILQNRKNHKIFEILPSIQQTNTRWYYKSSNNTIYGPLTTQDMSKKFETFQINPKTQIKKKDDDNYYQLNILISRYYKNVLSVQFNLQKSKKSIPKKVAKFKKGKKPQIQLQTDNNQLETYILNKRQRVNSTVPPFYIKLKSQNSESRLRSKTDYQIMRNILKEHIELINQVQLIKQININQTLCCYR